MHRVRRKMGRFEELIPLEEAFRRMDSVDWKQPVTETLPPQEAHGRIVSEDTMALGNIPEWNRSLVDGFAVLSDDCAAASETNPAVLAINGVIEAGSSSFSRYTSGQCTEIYTGGLIPEPYDSVIMVEDVEVGGGKISVFARPRKWENVQKAGDDIASGSVILQKSGLVRPWHVSAMTGSGTDQVRVFRKLRIGVIATGNELFPGSEGYIPNTTQELLVSYLNRPFLDARAAGVAHDSREEIAEMIEAALEKYDCLVVTGGTSLGGRDEVPESMEKLGTPVFAGSMIRPGRTLTLYRSSGKPVFSVSGIPIPSLLSFDLFFEHFLKRLLGFSQYRRTVWGKLSQPVSNKAGYAGIYRVRVRGGPDGTQVDPVKSHGTGTLGSILNADGTMLIPGTAEGFEQGELVPVKLFGDYI